MCKHFIGIDPGEHGGVAVMNEAADVISIQPLAPLSILGIYEYLSRWAKESTFAAMEMVTGITSRGNMPGAHMHTFGRACGILECALTILSIAPLRLQRPTPQKWQKHLGIESRYKDGKKFTESPQQFKSRMNRIAKAGFPEVEGITLATCDALLLCEYCRRLHEGL